MKSHLIRQLVTGGLMAAIALGVSTSYAAKPKNKNKGGKHDATAAIKKKLSAADLPSDALAKANKVVDDNAPKLKEAQAKVDAVLTADQKQAKRQAQKDAKSAGKKRKEAQSAIAAALKLTDEQQQKLSSAESELKSAQAAMVKDLRGALTSEQMAKVGLKTKKKKV